ncbi:MAG: hypothetical protein V4439_01120 [Patescibacteria group bacterium]
MNFNESKRWLSPHSEGNGAKNSENENDHIDFSKFSLEEIIEGLKYKTFKPNMSTVDRLIELKKPHEILNFLYQFDEKYHNQIAHKFIGIGRSLWIANHLYELEGLDDWIKERLDGDGYGHLVEDSPDSFGKLEDNIINNISEPVLESKPKFKPEPEIEKKSTISPNLVELLKIDLGVEEIKKIPEKKEGWETASSLAFILQRDYGLKVLHGILYGDIKNIVEKYRTEKNLAWFEMQRVVDETPECYAPELVELIIEDITKKYNSSEYMPVAENPEIERLKNLLVIKNSDAREFCDYGEYDLLADRLARGYKIDDSIANELIDHGYGKNVGEYMDRFILKQETIKRLFLFIGYGERDQ